MVVVVVVVLLHLAVVPMRLLWAYALLLVDGHPFLLEDVVEELVPLVDPFHDPLSVDVKDRDPSVPMTLEAEADLVVLVDAASPLVEEAIVSAEVVHLFLVGA